ncbi:MAG: hypothetical protein JWP44_4913 [Mucilaginibacter sp.]|nr:hypothetical protein [Mucilaginibacter sp.]
MEEVEQLPRLSRSITAAELEQEKPQDLGRPQLNPTFVQDAVEGAKESMQELGLASGLGYLPLNLCCRRRSSRRSRQHCRQRAASSCSPRQQRNQAPKIVLAARESGKVSRSAETGEPGVRLQEIAPLSNQSEFEVANTGARSFELPDQNFQPSRPASHRGGSRDNERSREDRIHTLAATSGCLYSCCTASAA